MDETICERTSSQVAPVHFPLFIELSCTGMDTEQFHLKWKDLQGRISKVASQAPTYDSELEKRRLWQTLSLIKMSMEAKELNISPEALQDFEATYPGLAEALSLRPHAKSKPGFMGALRFAAFFLLTTIMFPLFVISFPLRWLHPLLRKLGIPNGKLPYDYLPRIWGKWAMLVLGVEARIEGWEHAKDRVEQGTSTIGLFEHSSFIDFIMVLGSCGLLFKWIAKRSLYRIPMLGQMAWLAGMIPIDRGNLDSAKRSLDRAAHVVEQYNRCIAISPEGTRSPTGHLLEFKKGAFHLTLQCKVDATPMVLFGAYHLWPPGSLFPSPGAVTLRFLKPIDVKPYCPDRYNDLLVDTRKAMLEAMANPPQEIAPDISPVFNIISYISVASTYGLFFGGIWGICRLFQ